MSVKELITDSWSNMLKNSFIPKFILVFLAQCLVYFGFIITNVIAFLISPLLGFLVIIASIIIIVPISISASKVLLDVFQGRNTSIFSFVTYGYTHIKKIWAIIGRTFLKLLYLYIIQIILTIVLIVYCVNTFINIYNNATQGNNRPLSTSIYGNTIDSMLDSYNEDIEDFDNVLNSINSTTESFQKNMDSIDSSTELFNNNSDLTDQNNVENLYRKLLYEIENSLYKYKTQILQSILVFVLYFIATTVVNILIIIKSLLYTYTFVALFEDDSLTSKEVLEKSEELMRGNRGKYFWTYFLVSLAVNIIQYILLELSVILAFVNLIISILFIIYSTSYNFTFFNKISGKSNTPVEPTVEEEIPNVEEQ